MTEILIYGIVGDPWDGLDAKSLVLTISQAEDDLDIRINSPGGYVVEGLAIYNALIRAKAAGLKVTTHIDGLAASMATVIALAGDDIIMADNALFMIHNPWDCACGDAEELRAAADQLDRLRDQIVNIYSKRTGLSAEELIPLLDAETWFTSEQALENNFVTQVVDGSTAAACDVTAFGFRKAPESPRISAMASIGKFKAAPPAPPAPQEKMMDLYTTRAALVAAIAKFQKDGGTQDEIDKISKSAVALGAQDALPATGALALVAAPAPAPAPAPAQLSAADVTTATAQAVANERSRVSMIRALGQKHKMDDAFIDGLVEAGTSLAAARDSILDKLAERSDSQPVGHTPIIVGADARDKWMSGAAAWLYTKAGVAHIVKKAAQARGETIDLNPGEFRGVSCTDLARDALMNSGVRLASRDPKAIIGTALTAQGAVTQGTGDFTVLLENVMHKTLQAAYAVTPDTWSRFCGTGTVTDFRAFNRYLKGTFGALDSLNELGEFKNKQIPDGAKEKIQAGTKGNIIGISRQALVNDDMSVFSGMAVDLGRAAKLTIELDVYALLASNPTMNDGFALFDATHHKNDAATAAAPSVVSFDAGRTAMALQTDVSGNEVLDISPATWVGPKGLGGTVRVIVRSQYDPDTANKLQRANMVQDMVSDIVDTARVSGTVWYLFADKDDAPCIEVVFLNGVQEPYLENEKGWRVDGTEWKVVLDYGVAPVNWRSGYRNAGA